ncbi:hypothetical protein TKK_0006508 [Trichogramma kaykai]|uniref:Caprin-1 dimerization domain-containing protein n=1 Tax=Trichogramma kaykai TaxID=54128 RepID=A0ABD2XBQ4_9HYME
MPSVNPKLEKQASTESADPIRQAIIVIEHKIRNLEKRKGKLETYRETVSRGGELQPEQKTAVAKYDEVQQTLEITRELYKQIIGINNDYAKQQKKIARKEALERVQQDIAKVKEVLLIQDTMTNLGFDGARKDFLAGSNGAVKITEEDLKLLDDLYSELQLKHDRLETQPSYIAQAQKVAEHFVHIVDGKQREVVGTTYARIKEIINSVHECGYFDRVQAVEKEVEEVTQDVAETSIADAQPSMVEPPQQQQQQQPQQQQQQQQPEEFAETSKPHIPQPQPAEVIPPAIQTFPVPVAAIPVVSGATPLAAPIPVVAPALHTLPQASVDSSFYTSTGTFVPTTQVPPQFSHQQQPQPVQAQVPPQQPQQPPRINDVIGPTTNFFFLQESELDTPENSPPTVTQVVSPVVSHIPPAATVVAAAVSLNAPIPTQTFTNQSFAAHVVTTTHPVIYQQQPPAEIAPRLPSFGSAAAALPQQQPQPMPISIPTNVQFTQQQPNQSYEPTTMNESAPQEKEDTNEFSMVYVNESDVVVNKFVDFGAEKKQFEDVLHIHIEETEKLHQQSQMQNPETSWAEQAQRTNNISSGNNNANNSNNGGGYRGRGRGRGNSNGYGNNRGRGSYQQNGQRGNGSYYRNNDNNYQQNGYQQRNNWQQSGENNGSNNGGSVSGGGNNGGGYPFKRTSSNNASRGGAPGGGPRNNTGERSAMDRRSGNQGQGQYRTGGGNNQRGGQGGANRMNYSNRNKTQQAQN